jgi:hypothetical protein
MPSRRESGLFQRLNKLGGAALDITGLGQAIDVISDSVNGSTNYNVNDRDNSPQAYEVFDIQIKTDDYSRMMDLADLSAIPQEDTTASQVLSYSLSVYEDIVESQSEGLIVCFLDEDQVKRLENDPRVPEFKQYQSFIPPEKMNRAKSYFSKRRNTQ